MPDGLPYRLEGDDGCAAEFGGGAALAWEKVTGVDKELLQLAA